MLENLGADPNDLKELRQESRESMLSDDDAAYGRYVSKRKAAAKAAANSASFFNLQPALSFTKGFSKMLSAASEKTVAVNKVVTAAKPPTASVEMVKKPKLQSPSEATEDGILGVTVCMLPPSEESDDNDSDNAVDVPPTML